MKRILCIWFPDWPLQWRFRLAPALRTQPVVISRAVRGALRVASVSPLARRLGIRPGMPLAEAQATAGLPQGCPADRQGGESPKKGKLRLQLEHDDPLSDREHLLELAAWCERYSPLVGLEDTLRPSSLLIDVTGLTPLFGGESSLLSRVTHELRQQQYTPRLALANTIGAAWALAHFWAPTQNTHQVAESQPPSSVIVSPGQLLPKLVDLPIAALRLDDATISTLAQLGLTQIQHLVSLPRTGLQQRFGRSVLTRLDQALGRTEEILQVVHPPEEFIVDWRLDHPTDRPAQIDFVLATLTQRLEAQLAEQQRGCLELAIHFHNEHGKSQTQRVSFFAPNCSSQHLLEMIRMHLEHIQLTAPVARIQIEALRTERLSGQQQTLFGENQSGELSQEAAALIDRLASRLGRQAVIRTTLRADAQPEQAWSAIPWVGNASYRPTTRGGTRTGSVSLPDTLHRPLLLQAQPQPLDILPPLTTPPTRFQITGATWAQAICHEVRQVWGPERIETGWWRQQGIRRDYYRIETTLGSRFWIFQRISDLAWFWQGEF